MEPEVDNLNEGPVEDNLSLDPTSDVMEGQMPGAASQPADNPTVNYEKQYSELQGLYGRQANELGSLRKQVKELASIKEKFDALQGKEPEPYVDPIQDHEAFINGLNDPDKFSDVLSNRVLNSIPKDLRNFDKGKFVDELREKMYPELEATIFAQSNPHLTDNDWNWFEQIHEEYGITQPLVQKEKLRQLAVNGDKSFNETFNLMRKGLDFETANKYAKLSVGSIVDNSNINNNISKIDSMSTKSSTPNAKTKVEDMTEDEIVKNFL